MTTPCHNCEGFCTRHQQFKTPELVSLCKTDDAFRDRQDKIAAKKHGPSAMRKFRNFSLAVATQFIAGNPTCTQDEVDERFDICRKCSSYIGGICAEEACGCPLDRARSVSKLVFKTSTCPREKW